MTAEEIFESLPLKQRHFVANYLANGFNATDAAKAAGYSAKTADTQGSRLLVNVKVRAVIAARTGKALAKREITAERVLDEIAKLAFFDPRKLFTADGSLIPVTELGDEEAASIAGLEVVTRTDGKGEDADRIVLSKIKLADKGRNLERLGRHLKLFTDTVEHTGSVGLQLIHSVPRPQREKA